MKIALVAWGYTPKPPISNSIYTLMYEYKDVLQKIGHQVDFIDEKNMERSLQYINDNNYDFINLHQSDWVSHFNQKLDKKYCFTCHIPYLLKEDKCGLGYQEILQNFLNTPGIITCSKKAKDFYLQKQYSGYLGFQPNTINSEKINFKSQGNGRAICLGWIQPRKQQTQLAKMVDNEILLDFVGPLDDQDFVEGKTTKYLGIWSLQEVYTKLTDYNCLVLISDGEGAPLVVLEALAAGLSVVVSESASANLHPKDFIKIVPDNILSNPSQENRQLICDTINEMIRKNADSRQEIREYARENFDLSHLIHNYVNIIDEFRSFSS